MSLNGDFAAAVENGIFPTLAELMARIQADTTLSESRRKDWASALRSLAKGLGQPVDILRAGPVDLRQRLRGVTPAMAGFRPGRWRNVLSLVTGALTHVGIVVVASRIDMEPSPAWQACLGLLEPGPERHFHAWRFARYCSQRDISPAAVDAVVLEAYLHDLTRRSLVAEPERAAREVARLWNAAADQHPDWPQQRMPVPDRRLAQSSNFDAYPETLRQDLERWLAWLADPSPFVNRPFRPLRPMSRATRLRQIRAYLGALIETGLKPEEIVDLAAVVTPARAGQALEVFWKRAGNKATLHTFQLASLVLQIGRHWAKLPDRDVDSLRNMVIQLRPKHAGMSKRTQRRVLAAAENPAHLQALIDLPATLAAAARRAGAPSRRLALLVQTAVLVEILLHAPIRLKNLGELRIGLHLQQTPAGDWALNLAADATKNGTAFSTTFPKEASRLISTYVTRYRPLLAEEPRDWLSPGAIFGQPKTLDALRTQVRKAAAVECGLELTPHDFRALCGYLLLREDRGAHGLVQRILGHKNLQTTLAHYSGLEAALAVTDYGTLIEGLRDGSPVRSARPTRPRKPRAGAPASPGSKPQTAVATPDRKSTDALLESLTEEVS
ncbi:site-specific integrase [Neoroseomonas rubea]|uniref:site-specific integrase n=1 Tax=Neoroseomonas rubea TaxID=2748666 RepID=UPI0018DF82D3|nr:site-specific integrase [Roseomonas rubea]